MPTLTPGKPVTVREPQLLVENRLRPGRYRFRLVVFDDGGLESDPAEMIVSVQDAVRPTEPPVRHEDILDHIRLRPDIGRVIRRPP
jgi:hypothetical protein